MGMARNILRQQAEKISKLWEGEFTKWFTTDSDNKLPQIDRFEPVFFGDSNISPPNLYSLSTREKSSQRSDSDLLNEWISFA